MNNTIKSAGGWAPNPGLNILTGSNGSGKTKLLDKIYKEIQTLNHPQLPPGGLIPFGNAPPSPSIILNHTFTSREVGLGIKNPIRLDYIPVLWRATEEIFSLEVRNHHTGEPITGNYLDRNAGNILPVAVKIDVVKKTNQLLEEFSKLVAEKDELILTMQSLSNTGDAIAEVLRELDRRNPAKKVNDAIIKLGDFFRFKVEVPGLDQIRDGHHRLDFIDRDGKPFDANEMSSGERVIFYLLLTEQLGEFSGMDLLLLDEVDAHLNPTLIKEYYRLIKSVSQTCQVIAITHNPILANLADNELWWVEKEIVCHSPRKTRQEIINRLADGLFTADEIQGIFSLFSRDEDQKDWIILVEGKNDQTTMLRELVANVSGIKFEVVNCKGADNISIFTNLPYRETHQQTKSPQKIICLFDFDSKGIAAKERLVNNSTEKKKDKDVYLVSAKFKNILYPIFVSSVQGDRMEEVLADAVKYKDLKGKINNLMTCAVSGA